jgi:hypothetical protein
MDQLIPSHKPKQKKKEEEGEEWEDELFHSLN